MFLTWMHTSMTHWKSLLLLVDILVSIGEHSAPSIEMVYSQTPPSKQSVFYLGLTTAPESCLMSEMVKHPSRVVLPSKYITK